MKDILTSTSTNNIKLLQQLSTSCFVQPRCNLVFLVTLDCVILVITVNSTKCVEGTPNYWCDHIMNMYPGMRILVYGIQVIFTHYRRKVSVKLLRSVSLQGIQVRLFTAAEVSHKIAQSLINLAIAVFYYCLIVFYVRHHCINHLHTLSSYFPNIQKNKEGVPLYLLLFVPYHHTEH